MEETVFSKIIKGEIPSHKVYEDEHTYAFLTIHPGMPGHTLVVPKNPVDSLWDLDDHEYSHLWMDAKKIAQHIQPIMGTRRVGVMVMGFGVPHAHIHLVPINHGYELKEGPEDIEPDHEELAKIAEKLRF